MTTKLSLTLKASVDIFELYAFPLISRILKQDPEGSESPGIDPSEPVSLDEINDLLAQIHQAKLLKATIAAHVKVMESALGDLEFIQEKLDRIMLPPDGMCESRKNRFFFYVKFSS